MAVGAYDNQILQSGLDLSVRLRERAQMMHLAELGTELAIELAKVESAGCTREPPRAREHLLALGGYDARVALPVQV